MSVDAPENALCCFASHLAEPIRSRSRSFNHPRTLSEDKEHLTKTREVSKDLRCGWQMHALSEVPLALQYCNPVVATPPASCGHAQETEVPGEQTVAERCCPGEGAAAGAGPVSWLPDALLEGGTKGSVSDWEKVREEARRMESCCPGGRGGGGGWARKFVTGRSVRGGTKESVSG